MHKENFSYWLIKVVAVNAKLTALANHFGRWQGDQSMQIEELANRRHLVDSFGDLNAYQKGVVARALLENLIGKGVVVTDPNDDRPGEIAITVDDSDLRLLARFSKRVKSSEEDDDREILLDQLCQVR